MPRRSQDGTVPSWSRLCRLAATQAGYLTRVQARSAGFSPQLLQYYIQKGLVERTHRSVFHMMSAPRAEHEDLIALWLWSKQQGVFSHETALVLHELADPMPAQLTLTVPISWRKRRLRLPERSVIFYDEVGAEEKTQRGPLVMTSVLRTLVDCLLSQVDPAVVERAVRHAVKRKLTTRARLHRALREADKRPRPLLRLQRAV